MPASQRSKIPAVSVLMATFNNGCYLREALDDILGQTFSDFELILVDDGSSDDTQEILRSYRDPRLVLLRNEQRRGVGAARNRAIAASRASLIAVADADDRYDSHRLEKQVRYLQRHPEVDIVVSDFFKMTEDGKIFERVRIPRTNAQIKFNFLWQSPLSHPTALCRREVVLKSGGYDESLSSAVDTDWFACMSEYATFGVIPQALHSYRKHPHSTSENHDPSEQLKRLWISHRQVCKYLGREIPASEGRALCDLLCAYAAVAPEEVHSAIQLLIEILRKARYREDRSTLAWVRSRISASLLNQSRNLSYISAPHSRRLLIRAICLNWRSSFGVRPWVQAARLLTARARGKVITEEPAANAR